MLAVGKSLFQSLCEHIAIEIELVCNVINIVVVFHSAGEFHQTEDCVYLFCNGGFNRIGVDGWCIKICELCWDLPLFLLRHNNVAYTEINAEGCFGVLNTSDNRCSYTGILFSNRYGRNILDFEGYKVIAGLYSNDFFKNGF